MNTPTSRRARWIGPIVALLGVGGAAAYFLTRPTPPAVPEVDLSQADAEVAAAVTNAIERVRAEPRNGALWGRLGMVLRAHDFDTASVRAFEVAEKYDPATPKWPYLRGLTLVLIDPEAGLESLRRAVSKTSDSQIEPKLRLAEVLLDRGQVAEAEQLASAVAGRRSSDARAAFVLARVAAERGEWAGVLARTEALRGDPSAQRRATLLRADALHRLGRASEADSEATLAAGMPEDAVWDDRFVTEVMGMQVGSDVELRRGRALLAAGQFEQAAEVLERAAEKARNPTPVVLLLGRAYNGAGNATAAHRVLSDLVRANPNAVEGWFQLGVSQRLSNDTRAAVASFETVVKLKPDHTLGYYNLGHARKKLGDRRGAEEAFEAALRSRPNHEESRKALAELRGGK